MNLTAETYRDFLKDRPEMEPFGTVSIGDKVVAFTMRRKTDGRKFVYAYSSPVEKAPHVLLHFPAVAYSYALQNGYGVLIRSGLRTYAYVVRTMGDGTPPESIHGVNCIRVLLSHGTDINALESPLVKEIMATFGARPVNGGEQ